MRTKRPLREPVREAPGPRKKNYITPAGLQRLRDEHRFLMNRERPAVTQVVTWAAGNGDRSENADYLYGKRRLRQIDSRIRFLTKRIDAAEVVDPAAPRSDAAATRVFFGATVTYKDAAGREYVCFVREDTRLPFMTMPDAVEAFLTLAEAAKTRLTARVYNVKAFSPTAGELYQALRVRFPRFSVRFEPAPVRQTLVDTWPGDVEDARARADWGFSPRHGLAEALDQYLLPALQGADR